MSKKTYKKILSHDEALLCRAEKFKKWHEVRDDHTIQRSFERRFVSRDLPDSKAAHADYSDGGKSAAQIYAFDLPELYHTQNWYDEVIYHAQRMLPKKLCKYRLLLVNCYKYRGNSIEIKAYTWPKENPTSPKTCMQYSRSVKKILKFFTRPSVLAKMRVLRSKIKC